MLKELGSLPVAKHLYNRWKAGGLASEWLASYPQLFDEDDFRLAGSQGPRGYHFFEWLGAITLHHLTGYLSLVSKFEFEKHRRKQPIVQQLLSQQVLKLLRDRQVHGSAQAPDLLMYAPNMEDWFFCEVKGPRDTMSAHQRRKFGTLARLTGRPVYLLRFRWLMAAEHRSPHGYAQVSCQP